MQKAIFTFMLLVLLGAACTKEQQPAPIVGTWKAMVPANPAHVYTFNEDGTMCHRIDKPGYDNPECDYQYFTYTENGDEMLTFTKNGKAAVWQVEFIGNGVLKVSVATVGTLIYEIQYFQKE
jgi:hypothetical protein